jgi:hypothetical protein
LLNVASGGVVFTTIHKFFAKLIFAEVVRGHQNGHQRS